MTTRLISILVLALCLLGGCGGGGGAGKGAADPPSTPPSTPPTAASTVHVRVVDVLGFAKPAATVALVGSAAAAATTDADGRAQLALPPETDQVLAIELPGHTRQYRSLRVARGDSAFVQAALMRRAPALTLADAAAGGTLVGRNAARLTLPAAALVDAQTGATVTGAVSLEMTPLNTASHEAGAFPGGMRAISGGNAGVLLTYGPVEYVFTQGGRRLQLASGQSAVIEMPLHATLHPSGRALAVGEAMPVWFFDPARGLWVQEGEGTVVASASATGLALRATVGHFSWWNPDHFENPVELTVNFTVPPGTTLTACCQLAGVSVGSTGGTAPAGLATATLPQSGGKVVINGGVAYDFLGSADTAQGRLFGFAFLNVPAGATNASLTLALLPDTDPTNPVITSQDAGVTTYSRGALSVTVSVSGKPPARVQLRLGAFAGDMLANADGSLWTLTVDTTAIAEGSYEMRAVAIAADPLLPQVASAPRTVVVDRRPPQLVSRTPSPGNTQASATGDILAVFNEPIDAASLVNTGDPADARVALRLNGPGGTLVPVAFVLDTDGVTLRLTPGGPLPTNTSYTVRLRDITDRAGNPLAEESWNFTVPVFARLSLDLRASNADGSPATVVGRPEVAIGEAGRTVLAWASVVDGQNGIQLRRQDLAGNWQTLPTLPAAGQVVELSLALGLAGQPVVAWTENSPTFQNCNNIFAPQLFVAVLGASNWEVLGGGALNQSFCSLPRQPRLAVDFQGRVVLVSSQTANGFLPERMPLQRFENGAWSLLGMVPMGTPVPSNIVGLELALDGTDVLILSSENRSGSISHQVSRHSASGLAFVGPRVALGTGSASRQAVALDPLGRVTVALYLNVTTLRVFRFEGSDWAALGGPATPGGIKDLGLVFDGQEPIVGWGGFSESSMRVSRRQAATGAWGADIVVVNQAGRVSAMRRKPDGAGGGPIRLAMTTGPFNQELVVFGADVLP